MEPGRACSAVRDRAADPAAHGLGASAELALIEEAWSAIQGNYVDAKGLDDHALAYGAIRGMTEAVGDEGHTAFMTAEEAKRHRPVAVAARSWASASSSPRAASSGRRSDPLDLPDTPAEEAGLQRGDLIIVAVDG